VSDVLCTVESGIARLTINRAESANALNLAVLDGLRIMLRSAADDPAVRVVALTGAGDRVFCAGADLKAPDGSGFSSERYRELLLELRGCPKPTVALARGHVMAGGLGLLLACDLAFGCADIHVSTPEINVGMFPMMVLALLYRHVGRKKATEMLFLGERMKAREASDRGIFNAVFERGTFDDAAGARIAELARKSPAILRLGKGAILHVEDRLLAEDLEYLERELTRVMDTADSREGMRAFAEKRSPDWKDR
jgi:enoyl-CoA hydratase/carnithine racemase